MSDDIPAAVWVEPGRMGGKPCIYGHRLATRSIARLVQDGGVECVRGLYPYLTDEQIHGAVWFEGVHGRSKKFRRWYREEWARTPKPPPPQPEGRSEGGIPR